MPCEKLHGSPEIQHASCLVSNLWPIQAPGGIASREHLNISFTSPSHPCHIIEYKACSLYDCTSSQLEVSSSMDQNINAAVTCHNLHNKFKNSIA